MYIMYYYLCNIMAKIKAILIDDEFSARNVLTSLLGRSLTEVEVIATASGLEEGVKQIKELQPDVVFLDVRMPNYAGYEIVDFFDEINFEIIFVTAYDQYAIKAFELNAIDYLVKPIDRNKLATTLQKLKDKLNLKSNLIDYKALLKTIKEKKFKKLVIPEAGNRRVINLDDIIAIEADGSYSKLHLTDNKLITTSKNLKYFEDVLPEEASFFRSHRAWIVNLAFIEYLNKTTLNITLANGNVTAKVSRNRIEDFNTTI